MVAFLAIVVIAATSQNGSSQVIANSSTGTFLVSNDDLIEGLTPAIAGGIEDQEGLNSDTGGVSLTNGTFGPAGLTNNPGPNPELTIIDNGVSLTYTLAAASNITGINVYSGWRDAGRVNQNYEILYTTTANPVFQSLMTIGQTYAGGGPASLEVLISDLGLNDVTAIRFSFSNVQNGFVGYKEIDVIGTAGSGGSGFQITDIQIDGDRNAALTWRSRNGTSYAVDASTALKASGTPGGWIEIDDGVEGDPDMTTFIVPLANYPSLATADRVFFRVRNP